jgi:hypothetical protein
MKELCPCADLDWREVDQTLAHHPECKANEVQTVTIDAPIILPLELADPLEYRGFGESGAAPFDGTKDSIDLTNDRIVVRNPAQMPSAGFWIEPMQSPASVGRGWRVGKVIIFTAVHCDSTVTAEIDGESESFLVCCPRCGDTILRGHRKPPPRTAGTQVNTSVDLGDYQGISLDEFEKFSRDIREVIKRLRIPTSPNKI